MSFVQVDYTLDMAEKNWWRVSKAYNLQWGGSKFKACIQQVDNTLDMNTDTTDMNTMTLNICKV